MKYVVVIVSSILLVSACGGDNSTEEECGPNSSCPSPEINPDDDTGDSSSENMITDNSVTPADGSVRILLSSLPSVPSVSGVSSLGSGQPIATSGTTHPLGQWIGREIDCPASNDTYLEDGTYIQDYNFGGTDTGIWAVYNIEYSDGAVVPMIFDTFNRDGLFISGDPRVETAEGLVRIRLLEVEFGADGGRESVAGATREDIESEISRASPCT